MLKIHLCIKLTYTLTFSELELLIAYLFYSICYIYEYHGHV